MTKLISYSLFNAPCEEFERRAYIRGFYWNARMNNLIYPDWRTHLEVSTEVYKEFENLFEWLVSNNNLSLQVNPHPTGVPLCEGMLWRMKPIWKEDISHVLCRDADAITTYREAQAIQVWLESGFQFHAINDNPSHGGLMGGMVGFETSAFKAISRFNSFDAMITGEDLSQRGSDQYLLNLLLNSTKFRLGLLCHQFEGAGCNVAPAGPHLPELPMVEKKYWESNLVTRHIGSAGVVELELLRFFKRHEEYWWKFQPIEKEFKTLFPWHL